MTREGNERLAGQAWRSLRGVLESHQRIAATSSEDLGLSPVMTQFLRALHALPTGPMTQLVDYLDVDPAWVTAVVDKLEARGDVVRVPSPVDRRVKMLELTGHGQATWRRVARILATPPPQLKELEPRDLEDLVRIAGRLSTIAHAAPVAPTRRPSRGVSKARARAGG
jgi:DNA-binding MarR family transcriptional regulator